jgi:hypothetical protein
MNARAFAARIVELERIDLAAVKLRESFADVIKQLAQLLLVVLLAHRAPPSLPRGCGSRPRPSTTSRAVNTFRAMRRAGVAVPAARDRAVARGDLTTTGRQQWIS